ncbi:MAG: hypothetical protein HQK83_03045 [Fibrobacteria bacterium]|nr:hypothetical protein [Fibrobacteria bacterium]
MFLKNTLILCGVLLTLFSNTYGSSEAASTFDVTFDMYSGQPNPVCTLTDSLSISLLKHRIDSYRIYSFSHTGCPEPLTGSGYRGIQMVHNEIPISVSNGTITILHGPFCDYRSELEQMAVRFCKSETFGTQTDIMQMVPETLYRDFTTDGLFTIEQPSGSFFVDFSLLGTGYHYLSVGQDSVRGFDIVFSLGSGVRYLFQAPHGMADMGNNQDFPVISDIRIATEKTDSLLKQSRAAFDSLHLVPPDTGYQENFGLTEELTPGRMFVIKTEEKAYVAVIFIGFYIGGVDRYHFYYSYTTDGIFRKNGGQSGTTHMHRELFREKNNANMGSQGRSSEHGDSYNVRGQKLQDASCKFREVIMVP